MPLVIDASVAAVWALHDEDAPIALAALDRLDDDDAVVPGLFWYEIRNILIINERRRRLVVEESRRFIVQLTGLRVEIDNSRSGDDVLNLARRHGLTVYDSSYLELAKRRSLQLATLDRRLATAAAAEGVALFTA